MTVTIDGTGSRFVDEALFVADPAGGWALRGSRCDSCGTVSFPAQQSCPKCTGSAVSEIALPTRGTLWAYTIQGFPPKTPYLNADERPFRPYAVGYVNLGDEILVESRLIADDVDSLEVGDALQLILEPIRTGDDGAVYTFAFTPSTGSETEVTS